MVNPRLHSLGRGMSFSVSHYEGPLSSHLVTSDSWLFTVLRSAEASALDLTIVLSTSVVNFRSPDFRRCLLRLIPASI